MGNVKVVCDGLRATQSQPAARGLLDHANRLLDDAWSKFLPQRECSIDLSLFCKLEKTMH